MIDRLPPGPRIPLLPTIEYMIDPYAFYGRLARRYGDPFTLRSPVGPLVLTGDPEGVRAIFAGDPETFQTFAPDLLEPMLGSTSLILVSGARHRRDRKLLTPAFHGARMRAYGTIMAAAAREEAARWRVEAPFSMQDSTQAISLQVILRAVFGVVEPERVARFHAAVLAHVHAATPALLFFPILRRDMFGLGPWARFRRATTRLDALIFEEIAARRARGASGEDILSMMMSARYEDGGAMSDAELRDELLTLLVAGHETTAITLAWAYYWIHRDEAVRARLLAELDSLGSSPEPEAIAALPYLDAVCQETLRLYPIVSDVARMLRRPLVLKGYTLPAGVAVAAATGLLHMNPALYPDPERFDPTRYLTRKFTPFEYAPFGGGARRCLGAAFATYEMKVVLATLLREHRVRLADTRAIGPVRRSLTMGPARGVPVVYEGPRTPTERARESASSG